MGKMVGIDLGTTNSVVAIADRLPARILDNKDGKPQTRSVVSLKKRKRGDGSIGEEILVGDIALYNWPLAPKDTIFSVKRLMGRAVGDPEVQRIKAWADYEIVAPSDGTKESVRVVMGGKEYSPIDISAMILKKVKEDAEFRLGEDVSHAVITVPAYFSERQRDATRKAGLQAGLKVMKILDEPTAAAIAFGIDAGESAEPKAILVYDLGGGTFDISVLVWVGNVFAPVDLEGDMWLGGDNFDQAIVENALTHVRENHGLDPVSHPRFMAELRKAAQQAKEHLGAAQAAEIILPGLLTDGSGDLVDIELEITRAKFESMIRSLVARTMQLTQKALKNAGYAPEQVDYVLMAGNATCIPAVQRAIEELVGQQKVLRSMHPKHCVALGAAILASRLKGVVCQCGNMNRFDAAACEDCGAPLESGGMAEQQRIEATQVEVGGIAPFHYGTQSAGDRFNVFIGKSDPYPTENPKAQTFYTPLPDARIISIPVYGGDRLDQASANERQGQAFAILPPGLPQDTPVRIQVWLDEDGTFQVTAHLEDGTDLHAWIQRGEADAKATEAIERAEEKIAKKGEKISPQDRMELDNLREKVFDEMRRGNYAGALGQAEKLDKEIANLDLDGGKAGQLAEAENAISFIEYVLSRYGWAFDPNLAYALSKMVEETRAAMERKNTKLLGEKIKALDTAYEKLPEAVRVFVSIGGAIHTHIGTVDPALGSQLREELDEVERAFRANPRTAQDKLARFIERVGQAIKEVEKQKPAARTCSVCQAEVPLGQRSCPNGHDTWLLREGGAGTATVSLGGPPAPTPAHRPKGQRGDAPPSFAQPCEPVPSVASFSDSRRKGRPEMPGTLTDRVHFTVTAPAMVTPGMRFVLDVGAHLEKQRQEVVRRAREAAGTKEILIREKGPVRLARGSVLTVRARIEGMVIADAEDTILWEGEIGSASFPVEVPRDAAPGQKQGTVTFSIEGLQVAKLHFVLNIGAQQSNAETLAAREQRHRKAFASYASQDRDEVLSVIQGMQKAAPDLDVFLDVASLRSGQRFREELFKVIPSRDVFYLFWSEPASKSQWVEAEWRCALQSRGIHFIDPVPLVAPTVVPPPKELADEYHFNDWVLAYKSRTSRPGPSHAG